MQKNSRLLEALTGEIHHRTIVGLLAVLVLLVHLWAVVGVLRTSDEDKSPKPIKLMEVALVKEPPPKPEVEPPPPKPKPSPPKAEPPKKKAVTPPPVKKKTPPLPKPLDQPKLEQPKIQPQKVGAEPIFIPTQPSLKPSPTPPAPRPPSAVSNRPAVKSSAGEANSKGVNSGIVELGCPKPQYPNRAMSRHIEGSVKIAMTVSASGSVAAASVASAQPPGIFDDAALSAAKRCRFKPKIVNGNPVQLNTSKTFRFSLTN